VLEILDQSTARKTRHQSKGTNKQARQTAKEDPGMQVQLTKQSRPNTQGGKQTNKDKGEEGPRGKGEGRGRTAQDRPRDRKGETKEEKEHKQREERQQTKQKQRGREALTVLSQSTARKVRYL